MSEPFRNRLAALRPGLAVALAMAMFVATEAVATTGFPRATPIAQRVWLRYGFHLLLMLVLFGGPTRLAFVRTKRPALQIFRSLLMLAMPMCYVLAALTASGKTIFGIFSCAPLMVIALAYLAGERALGSIIVLVAIGCGGALVMYRPDVRAMGWGVWPALGIAASYSAYIVLTRVLDRTETMLSNLFYTAVGVFVALTLAAPLYWTPIGARELVAGAAIAVGGFICLWLLETGLRQETSTRLAPFLLTQTLLDGVLRTIGRGGIPAPAVALGTTVVAAVIFAAAVIVTRSPDDRVAVTRQHACEQPD